METRSGFVRVAEAAAMARVSYYIAYTWALRGTVKAEFVDDHWYVDRASLTAFLRTREAAAAARTPVPA